MPNNYPIPIGARTIMERLERAGYEAYLVGGFVRDTLIGREPSDCDITTSATPEETEAVFRDYPTQEIGKAHGTIGIIVQGELYEMTTYRVDGTYSDGRHPDGVTFTRSLKEDLLRRDFRINAVAMDLNGNIQGVAGYEEDLKEHRITAVGNPDARFQEDALRIMRGLRFAAQLGYSIEENTAAAIHRNRQLLQNIAAERIRVELDKTLTAPNPAPVLREFRDVFAQVIPELAETFDFNQNNPYHCYDVYEHILHVVEHIPGSRELRLAALFHDIGKPRCYTEDRGRGHFYHHEQVSADMTKTILKRLRYDRKTIETVTQLVKVHGRVFSPTCKYARRQLSQLGEEQTLRLIALERADVQSQAPEYRRERVRHIDEFRRIVEQVAEEEGALKVTDLAVKGTDLLALGIPQGPAIGDVLNLLLEKVLNGELSNQREVLLQAVEEWYGKRRS